MLQKSFTVDFLSKKKKINEGKLMQYYIPESHEAIIPPNEFELVQAEYTRKKELEEPTTAKAFSLPNWYVNAVADILVQKYGIRQVNTAEQYGNATESLKMVKSVWLHIYMNHTSKKNF